MIEIKDLSFRYNNQKVFENINFSLNKGDILSILGPNGSGKTTLIKCISGVLEPNTGVCKFTDFGEKGPRISYVPQAKKMNFSYNVTEFVSFGRAVLHSYFSKPTEEDFESSRKILHELGIDKLASCTVNQISGGELQMCYIAKALVSKPDVLILDEPESNLDFKNQIKIMDFLLCLSKKFKTTIIINTHFLNHAKKISTKSLIMNSKSYIFGKNNEIFREDVLSKYFQVDVKKAIYEECENTTAETFIIV